MSGFGTFERYFRRYSRDASQEYLEQQSHFSSSLERRQCAYCSLGKADIAEKDAAMTMPNNTSARGYGLKIKSAIFLAAFASLAAAEGV